MAIHPDYRAGKAVRLAVNHLGQRQTADGNWSDGVPFFPTLLAMSHIPTATARKQVKRALEYLRARQSKTGTWGRTCQIFKVWVAMDVAERVGA